MATGNDIFSGADDGSCLVRRQQTEAPIDLGAGQLDGRQRMAQFLWHALSGDGKVPERALRLCAPQSVRGNVYRTERIVLLAGRGYDQRRSVFMWSIKLVNQALQAWGLSELFQGGTRVPSPWNDFTQIQNLD